MEPIDFMIAFGVVWVAWVGWIIFRVYGDR